MTCVASSAARPAQVASSDQAPTPDPERLARCLIIGCGCRGRALARELRVRGHAVRGTTRDPSRMGEIEAAGAEPFVADPDRVATLVPAFDHVSIVCVLLGSAAGDPQALRELHGPRLEMLLRRLLDTTMHGVLYERSGTVPSDLLDTGAAQVQRECERFRIPFELLAADPGNQAVWLGQALVAVDRLVTSQAH